MSAGVTLGEAGLYQATASLRWQNNSSGARHLIILAERAGVVLKERRVAQTTDGNGQARQQVTIWHIAEPGDRIVVKAQQTSGADLTVFADDTTLDITRAAAL